MEDQAESMSMSTPPGSLPIEPSPPSTSPPLPETFPIDESASSTETVDASLAIPRGDEVPAVIEALLFSATQPLNVRRLSVLSNGVPEAEVMATLEELKERYRHPRSGLVLMEIAGGWQLATRAQVSDWVLRLHRHRRRTPLTQAMLEALAIIAYKQPITKSELEAIRGVDSSTVMRSLQDAGLVEVVGRRESPGRPPLYGTTEAFLRMFGLRHLEDLPSLQELRSVPTPEAAAVEQPRLGSDSPP